MILTYLQELEPDSSVNLRQLFHLIKDSTVIRWPRYRVKEVVIALMKVMVQIQVQVIGLVISSGGPVVSTPVFGPHGSGLNPVGRWEFSS